MFYIQVVAVFAVSGGCRCDELVKMCVEHIEEKSDILLVYLPFTKTHKKRSFTILSDGFGISPIELYRQYLNLRPKKSPTSRFFLTYWQGKCTVQPAGIQHFRKNAFKYSQISEPWKSRNIYWSFVPQISSYFILADCGADITTSSVSEVRKATK